MKISTNTKPVESGGLVEQGEFRIKNSAKAFSILSSGLYSNKHQAILRELGCNAYDSHVEAGKGEVPFTVHLPTKLNPTLSVRDYGVGLDHKGVVDIYTTYFESTKQDSNDFVGCMGLGSKSPFSYTDNFSVTAIKDGTKRLYTAFINDKGIPSIALLHEEETDEGNGVEVSFAVNDRHDMFRFSEEAGKVYKWFKVKPEITGQDITIPEMTYAEKDIIPGVHILESDQYSYRRGSYALMGNVAYPIKMEETEKNDTSRHNEIRKMYENGSLVVEFDIGELDIAASREELSYIPHTMESIYRKGEQIIDHLGTYIEKELAGAKTKWARMEVLDRLYESNKHLFTPAMTEYIRKHPRKFFKYTRFDFYGSKTYVSIKELESISKDLRISYHTISERWSDNTYIAHNVKKQHIQEDSNDNDSDVIPVYDFDKNTFVILQDDKGGVIPRIKAGIEKKTFVAPGIRRRDARFLSFRVVNKDADKDAIYKKIRKMLGNPKVVWTSTLPKTSTAHMKGKHLSVFCFEQTQVNRWDRGHKLTLCSDIKNLPFSIIKDKKYVYVPLQHKSIEFGKGTLSPTEFMKFFAQSEIGTFLKIEGRKIYGVNKSNRKLIKDDKQWVNLFDLLQEEFAKIDWKKAREDARRKYIFSLVQDDEFDFTKLSPARMQDLRNDKTPFGKFISFYLDNKDIKGQVSISYDGIIHVMRKITGDTAKFDALQKNIRIDQIDKDIANLKEEVDRTYPMLKHLSLNGYNADQNWKDACEYIKLVDSTL